MVNETDILAEEIPVEGAEPLPEELPVNDLAAEGEETLSAVMQHTIDEMPALSNYSVGDEVLFRVANVSDDGKLYDLEIVESMQAAPLPEEELAGPTGGGREAVVQGFLG